MPRLGGPNIGASNSCGCRTTIGVAKRPLCKATLAFQRCRIEVGNFHFVRNPGPPWRSGKPPGIHGSSALPEPVLAPSNLIASGHPSADRAGGVGLDERPRASGGSLVLRPHRVAVLDQLVVATEVRLS